jgi:DNA-binding NarL/FixJ family response regulator
MIASRGEVIGARTCAAASAQLATNRLLAAIVDVTLPDGSGLDVIDRVRRQRERIPVLVVTGRSDREVANAAFERDALVVVKPVEPRLILQFVERARVSRTARDARIEAAVMAWQRDHSLTKREAELLRLYATGTKRSNLFKVLGCSEITVKSHVHSLIEKTRHASLPDAAGDVLRDAVGGTVGLSTADVPPKEP